ncbi:MAG: SCP2 sterol-binding domain-containing protein [Anaerolineaceae bacterium]
MAKNVNRDYMSGMPSSMYFEKAKGIIAKIQFSLSGENGGEWGVEINDGNISVKESTISEPNLVVIADAEVARQVFTGDLDGMTAFTTGKIKLEGDTPLALRLIEMLK